MRLIISVFLQRSSISSPAGKVGAGVVGAGVVGAGVVGSMVVGASVLGAGVASDYDLRKNCATTLQVPDSGTHGKRR